MTNNELKEKIERFRFMLFRKKGESMIQNKLKALLLSVGLTVMPYKVMAFDWYPSGDCVTDVNGVPYAYSQGESSCDFYDDGDRIPKPEFLRHKDVKSLDKDKTKKGDVKKGLSRVNVSSSPFNTAFTATAGDSTLNIYGLLNGDGDACPLKVDGDVRLTADNSANNVDLTVNIQTPVIIMPYVDPTGDEFGQGGTNTGTGYAQLYFDAQSGRTITVNVQHNLEFLGRTLGNVVLKNKKAETDSHGTKIIGSSSQDDKTRGGEEEADLCSQLEPLDMILTFAGTGKTVFNLSDGTTVKFVGEIDGCNPIYTCNSDPLTGISNNAGGTKVFVTMEQTKADVDCFRDKLVFQRASLNSTNVCTNNDRVGIVIGANSILTYVSTDPTGIAHEANSSLGNFASVAFDPSNNGTGRMVLFILGAYTFGFDSGLFTPNDPGYLAINKKFPFNEGSLVVAGHHVCGYAPDDIRETLNYSEPAGGQAIMRVTDDLFYANRDTNVSYDPTNRRGLLVINDVQSVTKRASDPYLDYFNTPILRDKKMAQAAKTAPMKKKSSKKETTKVAGCCDFPNSEFNCFALEVGGPAQLFGRDWSYSKGLNNDNCDAYTRNVRNGFVVGVNGALDINHNTFLDYVAGSVNQSDLLAVNDYTNNNVKAVTLIKAKNPAAMIIDGLDTTLYTQSLSAFEAANPLLRDRPIHARVNLRGDGTLLLRAAGSTRVGYIYNLWSSLVPPLMRTSKAGKPALAKFRKPSDVVFRGGEGGEGGGECLSGENPVDQPAFNFDEGLLVGEGNFDGYRLSAPVDANQFGVAEKCCDDTCQPLLSGEGQHVIEFEGKGTVWSFSNTSILDPNNACTHRNYAVEVSQAGVVNMPSIAIDYTGREVDTRPLVIGSTYARYNSPAMFFNDNAHFVNTNLVHSDVTKLVDGNPGQSEPAVVGGERMYFASRTTTFSAEEDIASVTITDRDRFRFPEIQLYSSTLHLFDSLNTTGVRWVVKDRPVLLADGHFTQVGEGTPSVSGQAGNNTSVVKFYDHGDTNDTNFTGHGRIFQLGTVHSAMADGHTTNWATEGSYWNVFKSNTPSELIENPSASVVLSLQNGDQFPLVSLNRNSSFDPYVNERAHHLFLHSVMGEGAANMAIGWPNISADKARVRSINSAYPYVNTVYPKNYAAQEVFSSNPSDLFTLDAFQTPVATVSIDGQFICWGGFDCDGNSVRTPINRNNNQGVVYVNHGGKLTITGPNTESFTDHPYETIVDTIIAQKIWNDYNLIGDSRVQQLTGIVDLPHDQSTFAKGAGVQTYGFTQEMFDARAVDTDGYVRLSYDNPLRSKGDRSGAEEAVINWFNREANNAVFQPFPTRSVGGMFKDLSKNKATRATESVKVPVLKPARLLYVGTNDDIRQLKIAGATQSDPLVFEVSGDRQLPVPGRVREFVTLLRSQDLPARDHMIGEGDHAQLYLDLGGRVGLGSAQYNDHSAQAWTRLGKDHVQLFLLGDGVVDVNSNLLIADRLALIATTQFSQDTGTGGEDGPIVHHGNRLTFYSETPKEIRVPAGGELDLSSFGQTPNRQEIAFGGKIKLIFEEGATLRFPSVNEALVRDINGDLVFDGDENTIPGGPVILYFTDEAEIVFEGQIEPQEFTQPFVLSSNAQKERIKILGKGQFWLSKNAKCLINNHCSVGVQTDFQTPQTDVVISLHRQAEFNIGTEVLAGGAFEVGNPVDNGEGHSINFTLRHIFGGNPRTHIDREGFFGLGAGIVDKHGLVNGDAARVNNPVLSGGVALLVAGFPVFTPDPNPNTGWVVQALNNVNQVTMDFRAGRFEHNRIGDGSNVAASLMALGPSANWFFGTNGLADAQVVGGGNVMKVPAGMFNKKVNVWDYASPMPDGEVYSIMTSAPMMLARLNDAGFAPYVDPLLNLTNGIQFSGTTLDSFFDMMSFRPYSLDASLGLVTLGTGNFVFTAGYVNDNNNPADIYPLGTFKIVRVNTPVLTPLGNVKVALDTGTLNTDGKEKPSDPQRFKIYLAA